MTQPFIFIGTHTIKGGKLEDFKRCWPQFVDFIEESEPRLIAFNAYVDEDASEVAVVQLHPDVDAMQFHMKLVREHVEQAFAEYLEDTVGMQVYGAVDDPTPGKMRELGGLAPLIAKPHGIGGFTRSAAERAPATSQSAYDDEPAREPGSERRTRRRCSSPRAAAAQRPPVGTAGRPRCGRVRLDRGTPDTCARRLAKLTWFGSGHGSAAAPRPTRPPDPRGGRRRREVRCASRAPLRSLS